MNVNFNSKSEARLIDVLRRAGQVSPSRAFIFDSIKKKVTGAANIRAEELRIVDLTIDEIGTIGALLDPKLYPPTFDHIDGYPELVSALGLAPSFNVTPIEVLPSATPIMV